jgi:hypothetical protein
VSLFTYLFYRTEKTVVNEIAILLFSFHRYAAFRDAVVSFLPLDGLIVYSLPEGLWVFCITLTSKPYYIQLHKGRIDCVIIPLIYCVGLEVFQLLHLTKGRFDFTDIWISVLFWLLANYLFNYNDEKQNLLEPLNLKRMACFGSYGIVYLSHVLH